MAIDGDLLVQELQRKLFFMHGFVWTVHVQTSLHTFVMYSIKSVVIETEKLGASLTIKGDLIATAL